MSINLLPMDDGKLIDLVHSYPHLYDRKRSDFRDVKKKDDSWLKIAQQLKYPVADVQARWKSVREKYSREKNSSSLPSGSGPLRKQEWEYLKRLSWLDVHMQKRRAKTDFTPIDTYPDAYPFEENLMVGVNPIQESEESESSGIGSSTPKQDGSSNMHMKQEVRVTVKEVSDIMKGAFEIMKRTHVLPADYEDEDFIFSQYITSLLKSKSIKKRKMLKKKIIMYLLESSDESE